MEHRALLGNTKHQASLLGMTSHHTPENSCRWVGSQKWVMTQTDCGCTSSAILFYILGLNSSQGYEKWKDTSFVQFACAISSIFCGSPSVSIPQVFAVMTLCLPLLCFHFFCLCFSMSPCHLLSILLERKKGLWVMILRGGGILWEKRGRILVKISGKNSSLVLSLPTLVSTTGEPSVIGLGLRWVPGLDKVRKPINKDWLKQA